MALKPHPLLATWDITVAVRNETDISAIRGATTNTAHFARELGLAATSGRAAFLLENLQDVPKNGQIGYRENDLDQLIKMVEELLFSFRIELASRILLTLDSAHASYLAENQSFGQEFEDAFPEAIFDAEEASRLRALGRWTACVMHLMRVLEVGLRVLANRFTVPHESNWNKTLNELESKLRTITKRDNGSDEEQWAAETATHFRFIKNAFRNSAMHLAKFTEDEAVSIYDNTREFMGHLAKRFLP